MSLGARLYQHGKNIFFRGTHPSGGEEGTSGVENLQGVWLNTYGPGDWWLGRVHDWDLAATGSPFFLGHKTQQHVWILGSTRAGKGTGQIMYNLLTHVGSTVIVDPKGEGYLVAAEALKTKGKRVVLLDPMRHVAKRLGIKRTGDECGFNAMYDINPYDPQAPRQIAELAEILIEKPEGGESGGSQYWNKLTRNVASGLLAFSLVHRTPKVDEFMRHKEHKGKVKAAAEGRRIDGDDLDYTDAEKRRICSMQNIVSFCANFASMTHEERMKIIALMLTFESTQRKAGFPLPPVARMIKMGAQQAMTTLGPKAYAEGMGTLLSMMASSFMWVDSPTMERDLMALDFKFQMSMLKSEPDLVVFVVLPDTALQSHGAWLRMVITSAINAISSNDWAPEAIRRKEDGTVIPINLILDEAPQYGHIPALERLFSIGAGQGARAVVISQNKPQIDKVYGPQTAASLIGNSSQVLMAGGDNETAEYFSTKAGKTYQKNERTGERSDDKVPVWGVDEVWKVVHPAQGCLTYWEGGRGPMRVRICHYFDEKNSGLKAGVDYTQHIEHATLDDQLLKRGAPGSLASLPKGFERTGSSKEESANEPVTEHIMLSDGSESSLPTVRQ